jgi:hypothetical protein
VEVAAAAPPDVRTNTEVLKRVAASICLVAVALLTCTACSSNRAWPPDGYTQIQACLYNLDNYELPFITNGILDASVVDTNGVTLSKDQEARFVRAVAGVHPDHGVAGCYGPHHAFVFHDQRSRVVGWVEICFGCQNYRASSSRAPEWFDIEDLEKLTRGHGLPVLQHIDDYPRLKAAQSAPVEAGK